MRVLFHCSDRTNACRVLFQTDESYYGGIDLMHCKGGRRYRMECDGSSVMGSVYSALRLAVYNSVPGPYSLLLCKNRKYKHRYGINGANESNPIYT